MRQMIRYYDNYYEYEKGHKEPQFAVVYVPFDEHTLSEATHESSLRCSEKSQIKFASQKCSCQKIRVEYT